MRRARTACTAPHLNTHRMHSTTPQHHTAPYTAAQHHTPQHSTTHRSTAQHLVRSASPIAQWPLPALQANEKHAAPREERVRFPCRSHDTAHPTLPTAYHTIRQYYSTHYSLPTPHHTIHTPYPQPHLHCTSHIVPYHHPYSRHRRTRTPQNPRSPPVFGRLPCGNHLKSAKCIRDVCVRASVCVSVYRRHDDSTTHL